MNSKVLRGQIHLKPSYLSLLYDRFRGEAKKQGDCTFRQYLLDHLLLLFLLKKPDTRTYISTYLHSCNIHVEWREKRVNDLLTRGEDGKMVKTFFNKLKLGTLSIGGLSLIIFGAAGYASFAEEQSQCGKDLSEGRYIVGTFIPEQKK